MEGSIASLLVCGPPDALDTIPVMGHGGRKKIAFAVGTASAPGRLPFEVRVPPGSPDTGTGR